MVQRPHTQVHAGHHGGSRDRGAARRYRGVDDQRSHRGERRVPSSDAQPCEDAQLKAGQDSDVPSGNRNDVIGSGFLQAPFDFDVDSGAVANQDRGGNGCALLTERPHVTIQSRARMSTQ